MPGENYILLERTELNASAASVTFANIPQSGYTDLKIVVSARTTAAARDDFFKVQINGSSSNFSAKVLYGSGSGAASFSDTSGYAGAIDAANATANTFNNGEFYIPNYTSTTNAKSFSVDTVQEDNQAQAFITMVAGLWNPGTQAAITSITFVPNSGSFVASSTFSLYGIAAFGTTPTIAPKADGGNRIDNDGTYWYHTFTSSGSFVPQIGLTCDALIVGGGGGANQGGGGAGGYRLLTGITATSGVSNSIVIGAGGTGGDWTAGTSTSGVASSALSYSSAGGGRGPGVNNTGVAGGSGSGSAGIAGGGTLAGGAGNTPSTSPSQGNNGGGIVSSSNNQGGAGGGGAGAAGSNAPGTGNGGAGGAGSNSASSYASATSTGVSGFYAGGGGGGGNPSGGAGGSGGGGTGNGSSGTVNTGGGAGGAFGTGGAGGSGIVIIRYPIAS
jgi:hypothetical protein